MDLLTFLRCEGCREGLIAVNYAARDKGITRHMRVAEAKAKCPELTLVHVETIGRTVTPLACGWFFMQGHMPRGVTKARISCCNVKFVS